jgi:hypothetical protein
MNRVCYYYRVQNQLRNPLPRPPPGMTVICQLQYFEYFLLRCRLRNKKSSSQKIMELLISVPSGEASAGAESSRAVCTAALTATGGPQRPYIIEQLLFNTTNQDFDSTQWRPKTICYNLYLFPRRHLVHYWSTAYRYLLVYRYSASRIKIFKIM